MSDCTDADIRDLLPDLLHGRLDGAQRAAAEAHLRACADCRRELALLRGLRDVAPAPRVDIAGIVAALPAYRARRTWSRPVWRMAAAIVFFAVGASTVETYVHRSRGVDSVRVASTNDSARGAADAVELSVGYGYGDLSDAQLQTLLTDVQHMNAVPMTEPDASTPNVTVGNGGL